MIRAFIWWLIVTFTIAACAYTGPTPSCADLGCAGDLPCTRAGVCRCNGETCEARPLPSCADIGCPVAPSGDRTSWAPCDSAVCFCVVDSTVEACAQKETP